MTHQPTSDKRFVFPPWTNRLPPLSAAAVLFGLVGAIFGVWYYFSPRHTDVGYEPNQPIPYSHKLHAGDLGLDCRYCHVNVERAEFATVPPTQVCMNCHSNVRKDSPKLQPLRESWAYNKPVPWIVSLPMLVYRGAMLVWALWAALAVVRWLRWGWGAFGEGGLWKKAPPRPPPPPGPAQPPYRVEPSPAAPQPPGGHETGGSGVGST